jgi:hypothetical protein
MSIRAVADKKFLLKYLIIAVACIGFALWSLYDGLVVYPDKLVQAKAYDELADLGSTEQSKRWQALAKENGWSPGRQEPPDVVQGKLVFQFVMAAISGLVGIPLLIWYVKTRGTFLELNDGRLTASWGPAFDLDSVSGLDKRKWSKKGIAKVEYDEGSTTKKFKLDDFMYTRAAVGEILKAVEARLSPAQIVGGESEKPTETDPADVNLAEVNED